MVYIRYFWQGDSHTHGIHTVMYNVHIRRVGLNHIYMVYMVYMVYIRYFWQGRSYTVYIYGSGQPYTKI